MKVNYVKKLCGLFALFLILLSVIPVNSVEYFIPFEYEDHGTVISPNNDLNSIVNNCSSGTVITLEDGIYEVNSTLLLDKNITIKAENPFKAMIKGHNGSVISNHDANVSLIGLVITGGNNSGINSIGGHLNITKCNITDNTAPSSGGGLKILNGHFDITESIFNNNSVITDKKGNGGGLSIENSEGNTVKSNITNNGFVNSGDGGGIILINSNVSISESNIENNNKNVNNGGGIYYAEYKDKENKLNITRSNITNNTANIGGGIYSSMSKSGQVAVNFNRITNNNANNGEDFYASGGHVNVDYNWWGANNINSTQTNLMPSNQYQVNVDIEESLDERTIKYNFGLNNNKDISFPIPIKGEQIVNGERQELFFDGSAHTLNVPLDAKYELKIDNYHYSLEPISQGSKVYVDQKNGNDNNNGLTPDRSLKNIVAGFNHVSNNGEIILCNDYNYLGNETLIIADKNISIKSQQGKRYTLNGSGNNGLLFCYGVNLVLENLIIQNGNRANGAGIASIDSQLTVKNCTFQDNTGNSLGGAILSLPSSSKDSFLHVYDSNFIRNKGGSGSAIYSYTNDLELHNLNFTGNTYNTNTTIVNCLLMNIM